MRLSAQDLDRVMFHALAGAPDEVVGILCGNDGEVARVVPGRNVAREPRIRYELDPEQQLAIMTEMEDRGEEMVGIYHSHPFSPAYPSRTDLELAFYPDSVYLIVSLLDTDDPAARAFRIDGNRIDEVAIDVKPSLDP